MLTAKEARLRARDNTTIHSEISAIESAILVAVDNGLLTVAVNTSIMTSGPDDEDYWNVWQGNSTNYTFQDQMDQVIKYFENLNYSIEQLTAQSSNTFIWQISW